MCALVIDGNAFFFFHTNPAGLPKWAMGLSLSKKNKWKKGNYNDGAEVFIAFV